MNSNTENRNGQKGGEWKIVDWNQERNERKKMIL